MEKKDMERLMEEKYREVYSEELGRYVFVIRSWVEKPVFKRYKSLFGYTDIGWTVKHPKQLIRALVEEGIWTEKLSSVDDPNSIKNIIGRLREDPEKEDMEYVDLLEEAWEIREKSQSGDH